MKTGNSVLSLKLVGMAVLTLVAGFLIERASFAAVCTAPREFIDLGSRNGGCVEPGGGGGEIPSPFSTFNQKAELADGELYVLFGKIAFGPPVAGSAQKQAYLEVDVAVHPWLANQKRKAFPFYPILGPAKNWEKYEGQRVRLICEAQGQVIVPARGRAEYVLFLIPQGDHSPDSMAPGSGRRR